MTGTSRGLLVVVAGPSGVGKGTVVQCLLERVPDAELSVSATTRPPRPGEVDGHDYHFLTAEQFTARAEAGGFLEWAEYLGNFYGTLLEESSARVAAGAVVILEIEVQGARQVRDLVPGALLVFLAPPSRAELERRLRGRGTESDDEVARRLVIADAELAERSWFDAVVENDDVERACAAIVDLVASRRG